MNPKDPREDESAVLDAFDGLGRHRIDHAPDGTHCGDDFGEPVGSSFSAHTLRAVGADAWQLFRDTNESRGRFELPMLRLDRELSEIARRHSLAMARTGELFHTVDVDVYLHGIAWHLWGENVDTRREVPGRSSKPSWRVRPIVSTS